MNSTEAEKPKGTAQMCTGVEQIGDGIGATVSRELDYAVPFAFVGLMWGAFTDIIGKGRGGFIPSMVHWGVRGAEAGAFIGWEVSGDTFTQRENAKSRPGSNGLHWALANLIVLGALVDWNNSPLDHLGRTLIGMQVVNPGTIAAADHMISGAIQSIVHSS